MENAVHMLVPTHSGAGAEGFRNPRNRRERTQSQFKCSGQICRTVFVRQRESLFLTQAELVGLVVVGDIAAGRL